MYNLYMGQNLPVNHNEVRRLSQKEVKVTISTHFKYFIYKYFIYKYL